MDTSQTPDRSENTSFKSLKAIYEVVKEAVTKGELPASAVNLVVENPRTMDVKSLYTIIPNDDGLLALTHFLNKRPVLQPPTHTLVRLAELVLTLNTFSFNGNFYRQTGGVAMGSRLAPSYACLFIGHVEEQILAQYTGTKPALYKRYIHDIVGPTSGSRDEIEDFATYVNGFHPSLNFTWTIQFGCAAAFPRPLFEASV